MPILPDAREYEPGTTAAPPRMTFPEPLSGPVGSVWESEEYPPIQSLHHSPTLPSMS